MDVVVVVVVVVAVVSDEPGVASYSIECHPPPVLEIPVYTIQPVVKRLSNRVYNRLSNQLYNPV